MPASTALAARPAEARVQVTLGRIAEAWRRDSRGAAFVDALRAFLASLRSPNTTKTYTKALFNFLDWYDVTHLRVPLPYEVTRERAFEYAAWLRSSPVNLVEYRLQHDPDRKLEAAIYAAVKKQPSVHIADIRKELLRHTELTTMTPSGRVLLVEQEDQDGLDRRLGCMVTGTGILHRTPTIEAIRKRQVAVDPALDPTRAQLDYRVDPNIFAYSLPKRAPASPSTVALKLGVLHSFWSFLLESGENTAGRGEPLLRHNVWTVPAREAHRERVPHQKVVRAKKTPDLGLFNAVLGTTYAPGPGGALVPSTALDDVRDRALLLFALYVGARVSEIVNLRRRDVTWGKEPMVDILGKRRRLRQVAIPGPAYEALEALTRKLEELAQAAERQKSGTVHPARRLLEPDAPLFPPVKQWGCNTRTTHCTRGAVTHLLRKRALQAGLSPDSLDLGKLHPHGLRHLAAQTAIQSGTTVNVVQAVLGHESLHTTGTYIEAHDPRTHILFGGPVAAAAPPAVRPVPSPVPAVAATTASPRATAPLRPRPRVIATTGVPVEAPTEVPPEERLVAVGETAERRPVVDAVETLQVIYERSWGEKGNRQRLRATSGAADTDALAQVYAGRVSALVWWDGPTGQLDPSMPTLGPAQVEGATTPFGSVLEGLDGLYHRWMADNDKGPTGAAALTAWVREALSVAVHVNDEVERRHGDWLVHDAPMELGWLPTRDAERKRFRLHRDDRVVEWFTTTAWQHRSSRGRMGLAGERQSRVIDARLDLPAWYGLADPLAELSDEERGELFDWLRALVGQPPRSTAPRFQGGASRRSVAEVIGLLCEYDDRLDELKEAARAGREGREAMGQLKEDVQQLELALRLQVAKATQQRVPQFDVAAAVRDRIAATRKAIGRQTGHAPPEVMTERAEAKEATRESRRDFYLRTVGSIFGDAAATDPFLAIFALCSRGAPLATGSYPQLFRIDPKAKTIVHEPDFAQRFAQETHMHSECVARRLARTLWDLREKHIASLAQGGKGERLLDRPDELVEALDTMAAYRVPCPAALENELRARVGKETGPSPVYEEWRRWRAERGQESPGERSARERAEAVAETMAEAQERYREAAHRELLTGPTPNPRAREHAYTPNLARLVPSPVRLWFCLHC
jgi:integrase